jgi:diguanylate cyclase (GGDEF)-like protein/PAS domain S-box-containing protein
MAQHGASGDDPIPDEVRRHIIDGLITDPRTVVLALDDRAFRIPLPNSIVLPAERTLQAPTDRRTMIDLVPTADAVKLVQAWENAQHRGVAVVTVHSRSAADQLLLATLVDARAEHGVWLGALVAAHESDADDEDESVIGPLTVPARPRTGVMHKNQMGVFTAVDDRVPRMLGWPPTTLIGVRSTEFIHPDDQQRVVDNWLETLSTGRSQRLRLRYRCADDSWLWVEQENLVVADERGSLLEVTSEINDISDEMAAHEEVAERERLLHRLTEALPIGVVRVELDQTISYANSRVAAIFGTPTRATVTEQSELVVESERAAVLDAFAAVATTGGDQEIEISITRPDTGAVRRCALTLVALSDREGMPGTFGYIQDITESVQLREELRIRATFDALTGCHNRASVISLLDDALRRAPDTTWVLFLDLDGFKTVNDTLGHATGDEVLIHVADELRSIIRDDDAVGRLGGDEFLVVLTGLDRTEQAAAVADRVSMVLNRTIDIAGSPVQLGASIGLARGDAADTGAALTARADAAMYEAKLRRKAAGPDAWLSFAGVR